MWQSIVNTQESMAWFYLIMCAGILLFPGIASGTYQSLHRIYGYTRDRFFEILVMLVLQIAFFCLILSLFTVRLSLYGVVGIGLILGTLAVLRSTSHIVVRREVFAAVGDVLVGMLIGGMSGNFREGLVAGGLAGSYIGLIEYGVFSKVSDAQLPLYPFWVAAGGVGWLAASVSVETESAILAGIGIGLSGGLLLVVLVLLTFVLNESLSPLTKFVTWGVGKAVTAVLIWRRFEMIVCNHCYRYTRPFQAVYTRGIRYCEHCRQPVEDTPEPGKVILAFGNISPQRDGRVFVLFNPELEDREHPLDVSEVYIDTSTSNHRLLERFLAFMLSSPPSLGVRSVQIFYRGSLEPLGRNLANALHNTFHILRQIE